MDITVLENVAYGSHERHVFDLYMPQTPKTQEGLILFIHGGGWTSCDKTAHTKDCRFWSEKGYICATMNYRYVDQRLTVFDELDDVTAAMRKIKSVCAQRGWLLRRALLSGGSAGAHLSLLYAYTKSEHSPITPVAVFCHCPPTHCHRDDFLLGIRGEFEEWKYGVLSHCCGTTVSKGTLRDAEVQKKLLLMSPVSHITDRVVPTGICHGVQDELVPYEHTLRFLEELKRHGIPHDLLTYPNSGHAMDKDPQSDEQAKALMEKYLEKYLLKPYRRRHMDNTIKIGLNVFGDKVAGDNKEMNLVTDNGALVDFAVCHIEGRNYTLAQAKELSRRLSQVFEEMGVDFITNYEYANWSDSCTASDGTQWAYDDEGCHRVALPDEYVAVLCESDRFKGIMYDEFEHIVLNRNPTIQISSKMKKIIPVFPLLKTRDAVKQGERLTEQLTEYADSFFSRGIPAMMGEHNYPVFFHKFAESGITPNYKSLKENLSNVAFAMAAGAALQYDLPLYNCADCWYMLTNPGHTPEEMYYNLLFAYNAGVDGAYVESVNVMTEDGKLTPHGEAFRRFCREYKGRQRGYSIRDYRPEIGIIHYDDGFWGQWYPIIFKKCLLGNPKLKPDSRSRELFKAFNIITHGETCKNGFSWGRFSPWMMFKKHFSFVSMNSAAVFDHRADEKVLSSLKLCFLTGIQLSEKTLAAVKSAVKENGMTAVTPRRFAPKDILSSARGLVSEIPDGKGKWIVIRSYRAPGLKKRVKEYLGKKGEMRFTFTTGETVMEIGEDRKSFRTVK